LRHTDTNGITRTGLEGFLVYVVPNFEGMTLQKFLLVLMDAMGQLFYSISVSMGIMITYGSYVKKETNLVSSVNQIEIFDTAVAFLAGLMIVPAVFVFSNGDMEKLNKGAGLMFETLPQVFESMPMGGIIGCVFFLLVFFAAWEEDYRMNLIIIALSSDMYLNLFYEANR
jgi:NSS family neurotransmitter:Na+ symporter